MRYQVEPGLLERAHEQRQSLRQDESITVEVEAGNTSTKANRKFVC